MKITSPNPSYGFFQQAAKNTIEKIRLFIENIGKLILAKTEESEAILTKIRQRTSNEADTENKADVIQLAELLKSIDLLTTYLNKGPFNHEVQQCL